MMNYQFQLQNIKQQLGNIDTQFAQLMNQMQYMTALNVYNMAVQILNIGINMLNIGTQMPNMGNNTFNYALQIENIGMQIQNIGSQIKNMNNMNNNMVILNNNMMMPNQMIGLNLMDMNNNDDAEWMRGFKMAEDEVNEEEEVNTNYMNITFKNTQGVFHTLAFKYGTTIDEILKKYLHRVNKPDQEKICFLFNANQLKFGCKTKIEDFFKGISNPKVIVNDVKNLC